MVEDCKAGKIDLVITKSISRFARNIVDCLSTVQLLKSLNPPVGVRFETDNIYTLDNSGRMLLTILASVAEEESHTKSEIMKWSVRNRFGDGNFLTPELLGYDLDDDGNLVVNEKEAETVKVIFYLYLNGFSLTEIANLLRRYKRETKYGSIEWNPSMEPIAEGSKGILVETLLEGMAEYYSAELSEKVIRGQTENALKGKCTGGTGTIGYKIDEEKFYHLDPLTSPLVLEAFQRYDNGEKMVEIVNFLNDKGVRNMQGGKMTHSSVNTMLKNRRYIGELSFRDIVVPDAIPAIVPKDLFDRVQKRMDKNKRAPACGKADEEYLLTTKLFCGKCGALMFGESGTSATGRTYYYYKCANVKRRKGCNKKTVQKEWLEDLVVRETMKLIQDDVVIDKIVQLVMDVQNQENTTIPLLEKQLREVNKKLDNLMKAIEDGLYTRTTKERLEALEIQKDELTAKIADEKLKKPSFNEDFIRFWLLKFRKFDISQQKQRKALIEIFVNAIFLYDDRILITFNYKDGTQTVRFEDTLTADSAEEKSSDLSSLAGV